MEFSGTISHIQAMIDIVEEDLREWTFASPAARPWYRGQPNASPPIPSVFRERYDEIGMTLMFRERAAIYGDVPARSGSIDEWLFLMQHYGAPTRLLDWTESALVALFFSVRGRSASSQFTDEDGAIWVLHPLELNNLPESIGEMTFPNTWSDHKGNVVRNNLKQPFGIESKPTPLPIAIQATFGKTVMASQKSCFTIHGAIRSDFETLFDATPLVEFGWFRKYCVPAENKTRIAKELDDTGVTRSLIFPSLEGLALELKERFRHASVGD
jgi:hypothetical protein